MKLVAPNFYGLSAVLLGPAMLVLPFILNTKVLWYDYQRIGVSIFYALWLLYFAGVVCKQQQWEKPMLVLMGSVLSICLLQVFRGAELVAFLPEIVVLLGCATLIIALGNSQNLWPSVKYAVLLFASLQMLWSLTIVVLSLITNKLFDLHHVAVGHSNYRMLNHVQTIWVPLLIAIALTINSARRFPQYLIFFLLAFNLAFILHTGARATTAGLVLASIAAAVLFNKAGRQWALYFMALVLVGFLLKSTLFIGIAGDSERRIEQTVNDQGVDVARKQLWHRAWVGIQEAPWLGNGPQSYASAKLLHRDVALEPALKGVQDSGAHPHNIYLQIAYEWGIPVLFLMLGAASWVMYKLIKIVRRIADEKQKIIAISLFCGVVAVSIDAMFSGNFTVPLSQIWITILLGLTWNWMRQFEIKQPKIIKFTYASQRWLAAILVASIGVAQILILFPEAQDINAYLKYVTTHVMPPDKSGWFVIRFWSHGWF